MSLRILRIVFLLAIVSGSGLEAQVVEVGAGSQSCGRWVEARRNNSELNMLAEGMMSSWVKGYIIGYAIGVSAQPRVDALTKSIISGELSPLVIDEDPQRQKLAVLQKKFGTRSGWLFDPPDGAATEVWIDNYCREHPLEAVLQAVSALVEELEKPRLKK